MIVVDIETSGTVPGRHSILSIGAVDFTDPGNMFYGECRLADGADADPEAMAVNGFTEDDIADGSKITEEELVQRFADWTGSIRDITIAGHNVHFDLNFLKNAAREYRIDLNLGNRIIDMHTLAYASMVSHGIEVPLQSNRTAITSDAVYGYVGMEKEPQPHNALTGAKMEAEAISRLIFGRGLLSEFKSRAIPARLMGVGAPAKQ